MSIAEPKCQCPACRLAIVIEAAIDADLAREPVSASNIGISVPDSLAQDQKNLRARSSKRRYSKC